MAVSVPINFLSEPTPADFLAPVSVDGGAVRRLLGKPESLPQVKIDISEDDSAYSIRVEIPDAEQMEIKASIEGNVVLVSARIRREKKEEDGGVVISCARYFVNVARRFALSQPFNRGKAYAKDEAGSWVLTLPKRLAGNLR